MKIENHNGRIYVSAEPCHFGMIPVPADSDLTSALPILRPRKTRLDPMPMPVVDKHEVDIVC